MNLIKKYMYEKNIGFTELCQKSGLAKSTVYRAIKDEIVPDATKIGTLKSIATALGITINEIVAPKINLQNINIETKKTGVYTGDIELSIDSILITRPVIIRFIKESMINSLTALNELHLSQINISFLSNTRGETLGTYFRYLPNEQLKNIAEQIVNACHYKISPDLTNFADCNVSFQKMRTIYCSSFDVEFQNDHFKII